MSVSLFSTTALADGYTTAYRNHGLDDGCCLPYTGKAVFVQQQFHKPSRRHGSLDEWSAVAQALRSSLILFAHT